MFYDCPIFTTSAKCPDNLIALVKIPEIVGVDKTVMNFNSVKAENKSTTW
jgi:dihydrodipicolinate synthase/N-acetylneuraminate lyase